MGSRYQKTRYTQAANAKTGTNKRGSDHLRPEPSGLEDGFFRGLVEKVRFAHVEHEIQVLGHGGTHMAGNAGDERVGTRTEIEVSFGAHRLDDLADRFDRVDRRVLGDEKFVVNVFGA